MLVDSIYEAAILPERWADVLDAVSRRFDAAGGMLIRATPTTQYSICSPAIESTVRQFEKTPWVAQNVRVERLVAHPPHPGFLTDLDLVTEEETRTLPIYTQWLIPNGAAVGAATLIQDIGPARLLMSLEGLPDHAAARRAIPALDALRPHIARSAMLSARFQFERMRSAMSALDMIGVAGAMIDPTGRICAANAPFEQAMAGMIGKQGMLRLPTTATRAAFDIGLARLPISASLGLPDPALSRFRVLHMIPVLGQARDIFSDVAAFLILVDPLSRAAPGTGILQSLFDLTPAESRVADLIATGGSIGDIARRFGLSAQTVRTHMKSIFGKTGTHRQSDLVAMLGQIAIRHPIAQGQRPQQP